MLDDTRAASRRRKKIALTLAALTLILLIIAGIWWSNLSDSNVESGPVELGEALTDSADDQRR